MRSKETLKNTFNLLLISCLYLAVFISLYAFLKSNAVVLVSIVFVSYISWKRGIVSGLIVSVFNFIWSTVVLNFISHGELFPIEGVINISVHIGVSFLLGYFGKMARDLHREVETRKQVEAELKNYQNELEQRVEERTLELKKANDRLQQAERMEAIGQLVGGIAHDFNNYLNIIQGYGSLLIDEFKEISSAQESVGKIEQAVESASELASQLLTFARRKTFELQPVNIAELVDLTIPLLSRGVKLDVTIQHNAEADLPMIFGGSTQLQNAFINLGLNANDAMPDGGNITFTTKAIDVTSDYCNNHGITCNIGKYIGVTVSDTGIGIETEDLKRIFEPFFTTKPEGKGTGMGLATVFGIAKSHNGIVFVESQPGKGAKFTMLFPVLIEGHG